MTRRAEQQIQEASSTLKLDGTMSHREVHDALKALRFTAARGWRRSVIIDQDVRNLIVQCLKIW